MCGIAGRIVTSGGQLGRNLVELMEAQEHRGADSTGFAIYGPMRDDGYVLRGMGFDKRKINSDLADFENILQDCLIGEKIDLHRIKLFHEFRKKFVKLKCHRNFHS